jgi:4-hydroxy-tetrahydrodipicolinate synthase
MFRGSIVALVTPFKNGKVDEKGLCDLVEFHVKNGTSAILPCGTTGESATLSHEEHKLVIEIVVKAANGRIPVIAGTGSNSTYEALMLTSHAKEIGADGALLICPYYNRPTQKGLYMHFKEVADRVDIPQIIYNIPSRTGVNILPETVAKLAEHKNIVGIKEASGNLDQVSEIVRLCGKDFDVLSGDDSLTLPIMSVGGKGVISVAANIVPRKVADLVESFDNGDIKRAMEIHHELYPLFKALFIETNPIPVKTAMGMMGMISDEMRLPMCEMSEENKRKLESVLKSYGLL